jgi:hypothetical protein
MIGTTVGKYRIIGQLGRGVGMVYRAMDETLGRLPSRRSMRTLPRPIS